MDAELVDLPSHSFYWSDDAYHAPTYARLYPWLWFACEHPFRPTDEACVFEGDCEACDAEFVRRGCPLEWLPPLNEAAPVFRRYPHSGDGSLPR